MKRMAVWVILMVLTALVVSLWLRTKSHAVRRKVVIAVSTDPSSTPVLVAHAKGFFRAEGVDSSIVLFTSGKAALQAVYEKRADLATVADTVLMFAALDGRKISSIATIATSDRNHQVVALRERGIAKPSALAGRRVGVTERSSGEYFLYTLLLFQGIEYGDVTPVDLAPEQMEQALVRGDVDAVATWQPNSGRLKQHFGDRCEIFEDHSYLMTWNLVGETPYVESSPVTTEKVLKGLIRAKQMIMTNTDEAVTITSSLSGIDASLLHEIWQFYTFDIRLREVTLVNLEGQARWALLRYYPRSQQMPDFRKFLYVEGLRDVDPGAVSVVTEHRR